MHGHGHYGATPVTVKIFKNFFTNRKQITEWNGVKSNPIDLYNHSCVQGSCLVISVRLWNFKDGGS